MYVIIPCITGASKPNERLYENDQLQCYEDTFKEVSVHFMSTDEVMQHAAGIVRATDLDWQCGTVEK
jgi:hypothetical protein